jgi:hypothetical protein
MTAAATIIILPTGDIIAANHFPALPRVSHFVSLLYNSLDFPKSIAINYRASSQASRIGVNLLG